MTESSIPDSQSNQGREAGVLPVPESLNREALPVPQAAAPVEEVEHALAPRADASTADVEVRTRFVGSIHDYIRDNIRLADQKATFFFAGSMALLAFLNRNNLAARWLKNPLHWALPDTLAFVAMVGVAVGAFLALVVVIPRTPGSRRGFVFWEAIAEYSNGRQYADEVSMLTPATLFQVKAEHCHDLARVCRSKYRWLRASLWIGSVGLVASLVVFLLL